MSEVTSAASASGNGDPLHHGWDLLLRRHVAWSPGGESSTVHYRGFMADRAELRKVLDGYAAVPRTQYDAMRRDERLAFLVNLYNAWTIELVLTRYPELKSIKDLGTLLQSPWKRRFVKLFGEEVHLDHVEHELVRAPGMFDEPRIHFAVNCASIGCPALRPEAYVGARLDAQLDDQTRRFLRDRTRNRYEAAGSVMRISKLFDWYASDFNDATVFDFLTRYADDLTDDPTAERKLRIGAIDLEYSEYDWRLNGVR